MFQTLMVFSMVTCMATFNGFLHNGIAYAVNFADYLWYYPVTFCAAFTVRSLIGNPVTGALIPRFIMPRFRGVARGALISLTNVLVMATIMCAFNALLRGGAADFAWTYASTLPQTWLVAFLLNFLFIGPTVKTLFGAIVARRSESAAVRAGAAEPAAE